MSLLPVLNCAAQARHSRVPVRHTRPLNPTFSFVNIVKSPLVAGGKVAYTVTNKGLTEVRRLRARRCRPTGPP